LALNIAGNPVTEFAIGIIAKYADRFHHLIGRNTGAWICAGSVPVIDTGSARAAADYRAFVDYYNLCPAPCGMDGCVASGDTAAEDDDVGGYFIFFAVVCGIRPWHCLSILEFSHWNSLIAELLLLASK